MYSNVIPEFIDAINKKDTRKVIEYLQQGVNPNGYIDRALIRPLHVAVSYGATKAVELLLSAGADPLAPDCDGETPIQLARAIKNAYKNSKDRQKILYSMENLTSKSKNLH